MTEPARILASARLADGARFCISQPDDEHVSVMTFIPGAELLVARLMAAQAAEIAVAILLANPGATLRCAAERLGDEECARLGLEILAIPARRALERQAATEPRRAH
jgi:hypothetical protein